MLARLATFNSAPANDDDPNVKLLRETLSGTPGFVAGFHLRDPQTGKGYSFTVQRERRRRESGRPPDASPTGRQTGRRRARHRRAGSKLIHSERCGSALDWLPRERGRVARGSCTEVHR